MGRLRGAHPAASPWPFPTRAKQQTNVRPRTHCVNPQPPAGGRFCCARALAVQWPTWYVSGTSPAADKTGFRQTSHKYTGGFDTAMSSVQEGSTCKVQKRTACGVRSPTKIPYCFCFDACGPASAAAPTGPRRHEHRAVQHRPVRSRASDSGARRGIQLGARHMLTISGHSLISSPGRTTGHTHEVDSPREPQPNRVPAGSTSPTRKLQLPVAYGNDSKSPRPLTQLSVPAPHAWYRESCWTPEKALRVATTSLLMEQSTPTGGEVASYSQCRPHSCSGAMTPAHSRRAPSPSTRRPAHRIFRSLQPSVISSEDSTEDAAERRRAAVEAVALSQMTVCKSSLSLGPYNTFGLRASTLTPTDAHRLLNVSPVGAAPSTGHADCIPPPTTTAPPSRSVKAGTLEADANEKRSRERGARLQGSASAPQLHAFVPKAKLLGRSQRVRPWAQDARCCGSPLAQTARVPPMWGAGAPGASCDLTSMTSASGATLVTSLDDTRPSRGFAGGLLVPPIPAHRRQRQQRSRVA